MMSPSGITTGSINTTSNRSSTRRLLTDAPRPPGRLLSTASFPMMLRIRGNQHKGEGRDRPRLFRRAGTLVSVTERWRVPLTDVRLPPDAVAATAAVFEEGWLSMGPRVQAFEQAFAE